MLQSLGPQGLFVAGTLTGWAAVVLLAATRRGRMFAIFAGIMLGVHGLISVALWPHFESRGLGVLVLGLQLLTFVQFGSLVFPRLRHPVWRVLITWPGATFRAMPWAIAAAVCLTPWGWWLPYLIGLVGLLQSLRNADGVVDLVLDGEVIESLQRHPHGQARSVRPLRIVQITDPHLG